ncbi:MAG: hypothetical protein ACRDOB_04815 [Streptosporangiaceae bacterium]
MNFITQRRLERLLIERGQAAKAEVLEGRRSLIRETARMDGVPYLKLLGQL